MPAEVVTSQLIPAQGQEVIRIMDDFGTEYQLYVRVGEDSDSRAQLIQDALTRQTANEKAVKDYASQHGLDLTAQLAAGAAAKAALTPSTQS